MNHERRVARSSTPHEALSLYFSSLCKKPGVKAVALATQDGTLVAGAGAGDVEWMGAVGASSHLAQLEWDGQPLHVSRLEVNAVPMSLCVAGAEVADAVPTLRRIFSA